MNITKTIRYHMLPTYLDDVIHLLDSNYDLKDVYKLSISKVN